MMAEDHDAELITRLRKVVEGQGLSMVAMGKELRERDAALKKLRAEIARLRAPPEDMEPNRMCLGTNCVGRCDPALRCMRITSTPPGIADQVTCVRRRVEQLESWQRAHLKPESYPELEVWRAALATMERVFEEDCIDERLRANGERFVDEMGREPF